jgi:hypothetical protein
MAVAEVLLALLVLTAFGPQQCGTRATYKWTSTAGSRLARNLLFPAGWLRANGSDVFSSRSGHDEVATPTFYEKERSGAKGKVTAVLSSGA